MCILFTFIFETNEAIPVVFSGSIVKKSSNNLRLKYISHKFEQPSKIVFDLFHFHSQKMHQNHSRKCVHRNCLKSVHLKTIIFNVHCSENKRYLKMEVTSVCCYGNSDLHKTHLI